MRKSVIVGSVAFAGLLGAGGQGGGASPGQNAAAGGGGAPGGAGAGAGGGGGGGGGRGRFSGGGGCVGGCGGCSPSQLCATSGTCMAPASSSSIVVDARSQGTVISSGIYGVAFGNDDSMKVAGLNRWGGDATSSYNWQIDVSNAGVD